MDKNQLKLAEQSLAVYLDITLRDELIKMAGTGIDPAEAIQKVNDRLMKEIRETAQAKWKRIIKLVTASL